MINTEEFIKDLYFFLQENKYIPNTLSTDKERSLFRKLEKLHIQNSLSDNDYKTLTELCCGALYEYELNGFTSGIYLSKILASMV